MNIVFAGGSATEGNPVVGGGVPIGALSTSGNQIVDAATGQPLRLVGVNWHGAEGLTHVPGGMWARNYRDMMDDMAAQGFNVIRIPVSPEILTASVTEAINYDLNPDLIGKSAIEVLDSLVDHAGDLGMRVILDMHRRTPGVGKQQDGLWFSEDYPETRLIADWQALAGRYLGNHTVIGADLFNEPSGIARWSMLDPRTPPPGPDYAWADAAERIGNAVLAANPDLLILVEGVHIVDTRYYWVGGNLQGVRFDPVTLNAPDKLVYAPHDYPRSVRDVPWLQNATTDSILKNWKNHWAWIYEEGVAPILIGETGGRMVHPDDPLYMGTLADYLSSLAAASPGGSGGMNLTWWTWGPNSWDTGGILTDNWWDMHDTKLGVLAQLLGQPIPIDAEVAADAQAPQVAFSVSRAYPMPWSEIYYYETFDVTAAAGEDYRAEQGVLHMGVNRGYGQAEITLIADDVAETREFFGVRIMAMDGTPLAIERLQIDDDETPEPPQPNIWMGAVRLSHDTWRVRLEVKDVAPGSGIHWSTNLYSEYFDLSNPARGTLSSTGDDRWSLSVSANDGRYTTSFIAKLAVPADELLGLQSAFVFADPVTPPTSPVSPSALSPTGQLIAPDSELDVSLDVVQLYGTTFFGRITVTNNTDIDFSNWQLRLDPSFDIQSVAIMTIIQDDGEAVFLNSPSWNRTLEAGESFTFGVTGLLDVDPSDLMINYDTFIY